MKNLEHLITEANSIETLDELHTFCDNMIDQYVSGKQDKHRAKIRSIKSTVDMGIGKKEYLERWGREQYLLFIKNVCLNEKVI
jgi:hypothetical protein